MPTLDQMVARIRRTWLEEPLPNQPNHPFIFDQLVSVVQSGVNQVANTGQNWDTRETSFTLCAGKDEHMLAMVENMGKPLAVYTVNASDVNHYECELPIVKLQNLTSSYDGRREGYDVLNVSKPHIAQKIAFYERDNVWYAKARPTIPESGTDADYRLVYAVGAWAETALRQASVLLEEHYALFERRAAVASLSKACWWDDSTDKGYERNREKRRELAQSHAFEIDRLQRIFDQYITSMPGRKVTFKGSNW